MHEGKMIFFFRWIERDLYCKFPRLHLGYIREKAWKCGWEGKEKQSLQARMLGNIIIGNGIG
jgi:hypothetical protein